MSNFFSKYKLLLLLVFVFSFCIPTNVFADNYCFYFKGNTVSNKCMDDDKEIDCPEDFHINKDGIISTVYPKNLVGAYKTTKSDCITPDTNYYLDGKRLIAGDPFELQAESFLSFGEEKMKNSDAGKDFKISLIKEQLNLITKNTCCVPVESKKDDKSFPCGFPVIKYTDDEILSLELADFSGKKLLVNSDSIKFIDNESEFWKHIKCGSSDDGNSWEHWSISCDSFTPIVPNTNIGINTRDDLKHKLTKQVQLQSTTGAKLFNSNFCASTREDYCICKLDSSDCNYNFKSLQTCKEGLSKMGDTNHKCFVHGENNADCHPIVQGVDFEFEDVSSNFSGLNKIGETDIQKIIGRVIKILMGVIGSIALVMFVFGGISWMISAGNAEKTKKAMNIMLWAGLGSLVILASYAIVKFIFELF